MDVLIHGVENFFRRANILLVRRIPRTKTLRAHLLGLALALVGVYFTGVIDQNALFSGRPWYEPVTAAGIFIFGTWLGGFFVLLTAIVFFFFTPSPIPASPDFLLSLLILASWYFIFYLLGAIFVLLYNLFALLSLLTFGRNEVRILFAYDTTKGVNIIKSPIPNEEHAFHNVAALRPELQKQKFYDFDLTRGREPRHPYTIVFVANPLIKYRRMIDGLPSDSFLPDPIISDQKLFLRTVNYALYSFEQDAVVGQYPIWSRVRVVTIWDDTPTDQNNNVRNNDDWSLIQNYQVNVSLGANVAENLIIPRPEMPANVNLMLQKYGSQLPRNEIDVIFAVTASPTQIGQSAYYSDFNENNNPGIGLPVVRPNDQQFLYDRDPNFANPTLRKSPNVINFPPRSVSPPQPPAPQLPTPPGPTFSECIHDEYTAFPGRVALNALSARRHTFVHEFGHAMSSAFRGAIGDEYYDKAYLLGGGGSIVTPFYVNRIERIQQPNGRFVPVHQVFVQYNDTNFLSDLNHPSSDPEWLNYFPEREGGVTCTMDRDGFPYTYDKLLCRFIYDRLVVKLNR